MDFQSSPEGKAILKSMKRIGRSFNNFLVLITQSTNDLDDSEDGTGFGTVICFDEVQNREGVLKYLNLPVNEINMKWVSNMVQGQCLMKDMFGQTNRIVVHVILKNGWNCSKPLMIQKLLKWRTALLHRKEVRICSI